MGAVAADKASVFICDHRSALDADKAMGAADDQGYVSHVSHYAPFIRGQRCTLDSVRLYS